MAEKEEETAVDKKAYLITQQKQANTLVICDMIRLQIHLRSVLSGLKVSPKRKVWHGASGFGTGDRGDRRILPG